MNIHGLKLKIIDLKKELRKGKHDLGEIKFNRLMRKKTRLKRIVEKLKKAKEQIKKR